MTITREMRRLAALGKVNAVVMIADNQRLRWVTSSCHYSEFENGVYKITIWTKTKEEVQLLLREINRLFVEKKWSKIDEVREDLFKLDFTFEY